MLHNQGSWGELKSDSERENIKHTSTRRLRLGARLKAFYKVDIEAIADLAPDGDRNDLHTLKADIALTGRDTLSVGKFRGKFGYEGSRNGHDLTTVERTALSNLFFSWPRNDCSG